MGQHEPKSPSVSAFFKARKMEGIQHNPCSLKFFWGYMKDAAFIKIMLFAQVDSHMSHHNETIGE